MDIATFVGVLQESLVMILIFVVLLLYAIFRGKQALVNLILGLYLALLISLEFPYYDYVFRMTEGNVDSESMLLVAVFLIFTGITTFLFERLMPAGDGETAFEDFWRKFLLALFATILIVAFGYNVLPITDLIAPTEAVSTFFAAPENFFWWLLIPLVGLFLF